MSRRVRRSRRTPLVIPNFFLEDDSDNSDSSLDDNMGLTVCNMIKMMSQHVASSGRKKRTTKHTHKRQACTSDTPSNSQRSNSAHKTKKTKKAVVNKSQPSTSYDVNLLSDDEEVTLKESQVNSLEKKVNNFFKVIESSDDEDIQLQSTKSKVSSPKKSKSFYTINSDSDDDIKVIPTENADASVILVPDTSIYEPKPIITFTKNEYNNRNGCNNVPKNDENEDLFAVVNNIIDNYDITSDPPKETPIRSLEELKKKTEEILGGVASMIEEFNTVPAKDVKKPEVLETTEKSSTICPICLDKLGANCQPWVTFCGHMFCQQCLKKVCKSTKKCPTCRKKVNLKQIHPVYI